MRSALRSKQAQAVSVCGRILRSKQSVTVPETAIGTRERALEKQGKIRIRQSNKPGMVQILCTLGG